MRLDENLQIPSEDSSGQGAGGGDFEDGSSLSGHERNHLFVNDGGRSFLDASGLSGLDDPADGRAVAWLDYDRDGWLDFAVANANEPSLQLFRNEMGRVGANAKRNVVAVRLVGGNHAARKSDTASNRDGIGARVEVTLGDRVLVREHRGGEGFAAQNSATMVVGIDEAERADSVVVRWPSGREQRAEDVAAGSVVTFREGSGDGHAPGVETARYGSEKPGLAAERTAAPRLAWTADLPPTDARLRLYTTTATWCQTCRGELPDIAHLTRVFDPAELAVFAVPVDPNDDREKLEAYVKEYEPAYRMLLDLPEGDVEGVQRQIVSALRRDVLPASVLTDAEGRVLAVTAGVPTVSDLRARLATPPG